MPMSLPVRFHSIAFGLLAFAVLRPGTVHAELAAANASASILARTKAPDFAQRDFVISDFGAMPGEDCTAAIAKAIAFCQ